MLVIVLRATQIGDVTWPRQRRTSTSESFLMDPEPDGTVRHMQ